MSPILLGGRKPRKVKRIKSGKRLGRGFEGTAFETAVVIKKNSWERIVKLAEKKHWLVFHLPFFPFANPRRQFKIMTKLKCLNSVKKLGLHILPTIRLRKRIGRKPTLLLTRYEEINYADLSSEERQTISAQKTRELEVLHEQGYSVDNSCFNLIKDPLTGQPTYYLTDFGHIRKIWKRK